MSIAGGRWPILKSHVLKKKGKIQQRPDAGPTKIQLDHRWIHQLFAEASSEMISVEECLSRRHS